MDEHEVMEFEWCPTHFWFQVHGSSNKILEVWREYGSDQIWATINLGGFWLPLWPTVFSEDTDNTLAQSVCDRRVDRCDESPCG